MQLPETTVETEWLKAEPLWDPSDQDIEEWRILVHPRQIISGKRDDLFLSDSGRSRVLRISESGTLIEQIGEPGLGPGEFREPWDLAYDRRTDLLWIGDRAAGRIEVFRVGETKSTYLASVPAPSILGGSISYGLFPVHDDSVWAASLMRDFRLYCLSSSGDVMGARLGRPSKGTPYRGIVSNDHIIPTGWYSFWSIDIFDPVIHVWNQDGLQLQQMALTLPEISIHRETKVGENERKWYIGAVGVDVDRRQAFLQVYFNPSALVIYGFAAADPSIGPLARYAARISPDRLIVSLTPTLSSNGTTFYALDDREGVILRVSH